MKTLVILSLSLAVALGIPVLVPDLIQNPVLTEEEKSPLLGDSVPVQGHVVVEDPAPQVRLAPDTDQNPLNVQVQKNSKLEQEVEVKQEVQNEPVEKEEGKVDQEVKEIKPEDKVDPELKVEQEVKMERDVKVDTEAKVDTEVHLNLEDMAELEVKVKTEDKVDPEFNVDSDLKVESEVKVKPDELEVKLQELQEENQMEMDHEDGTETALEIEERHVDMEGRNRIIGEPIDEEEPLDDDNMFEEEQSDMELSEMENSLRVSFQSQDPDVEPLPEEEVLMSRSNNILDEKPVMELEPETTEDQQVMPVSALMDEGPALDIMGQEIQPSGHYFPNEEAVMGMELAKQRNSDYLTMEGAQSEFVGEESLMDEMPLNEEPLIEDSPLFDEGAQNDVMPERTNMSSLWRETENPVERRLLTKGQCSCPGVVLERKCYQFFGGRKRASDAEYFCQTLSPGGHLASITSQYIHTEMKNLIVRQNGRPTRTWIGGLRYLDTGRFIWLDGSPWSYDDWLSGEPNDTSNVEDCVEVLGNGKFNDFTCWEPQAFVCSFPY